ncbi:hypothetical protein TNCV_1464811 [Trichonephila clavipes]|nr:hypothetical protein TNCV_1464811 [Trichonephila clavipes]
MRCITGIPVTCMTIDRRLSTRELRSKRSLCRLTPSLHTAGGICGSVGRIQSEIFKVVEHFFQRWPTLDLAPMTNEEASGDGQGRSEVLNQLPSTILLDNYEFRTLDALSKRPMDKSALPHSAYDTSSPTAPTIALGTRAFDYRRTEDSCLV